MWETIKVMTEEEKSSRKRLAPGADPFLLQIATFFIDAALGIKYRRLFICFSFQTFLSLGTFCEFQIHIQNHQE